VNTSKSDGALPNGIGPAPVGKSASPGTGWS
jgi:hypothetical protein